MLIVPPPPYCWSWCCPSCRLHCAGRGAVQCSWRSSSCGAHPVTSAELWVARARVGRIVSRGAQSCRLRCVLVVTRCSQQDRRTRHGRHTSPRRTTWPTHRHAPTPTQQCAVHDAADTTERCGSQCARHVHAPPITQPM